MDNKNSDNSNNIIATSMSATFFTKYISLYLHGNYIHMTNHIKNIIDLSLVRHKNLLLVGFYNPGLWNNLGHYKDLINSAKSTIIYFVGFDVEQLTNTNAKGYSISNDTEKILLKQFFKENNKIKFISENSYQEKIIKREYDLDVEIVPMPIKNIDILDKCINFPTDNLYIGIYAPTNRELYNFDIIMEVITKCSEYKFYLYSNGGFKKKENDIFPNNVTLYEKETPIEEIYKIINCGIRITNTDGEPQTGVELLMLGKYFIFNHQMDFCNYVEKNKDIVKNIVLELGKIKDNLIFNRKAHEFYKVRNSPINFSKKIYSLFT
jgi:hypothetical protein